MKIKLLVACLSMLPALSYANFCANIPGITAPQEDGPNNIAFYSTPRAVCLDGVDITKRLKKYPDDKITGAFSMIAGDGNVFFVSIYSDKNYAGRILLLSDENRETKVIEIFHNTPGKLSAKPQDSVENIIINDFDSTTNTLYYSADAWAQAGAVHAIKWGGVSDPLSWTESFLHDGTFEGVYKGMPMVSTIRHDNNGVYFPSLMLRNDDGSVFCTLDTRQKLWQLSPQCLIAGDDYRAR